MSALLEGLASLFDFTGYLTTRRSREILERSDAEALRSDWEAIGQDMKNVMGHRLRSCDVCSSQFHGSLWSYLCDDCRKFQKEQVTRAE